MDTNELDELTNGLDLVVDALADAAGYDQIITEANRAVNARKRRGRDVRYLSKLKETAKFLQNVAQGKVDTHTLREVLSTSDFPILFGDILDRRLVAQYAETTPSWSQYISRGTVPDFRQSRLIAIDGMQTPFTYKKEELADVKYDNSVTETGYTTQVNVYEKGYAINWRMIVNRSLSFVTRMPQLLARGARRTEEKLATQLFVGAAGPNSTFFAAGNANLVTTTYGAASNNPALSVQGIKDALNVMYRQTDDGDPIEIMGVTLVVPPVLQITAREILKALSYEYVPAESAAGVRVLTPNWANSIKLAVNWYLPIVDQTANKHTTWYLFADPNVGRPAAELTFLEGYEQPSFWQKAPNTMRMGSSSVDATMGDFEDMSQHYKGLHIIGGTLVDPKMAVVSNGSGS